MKIVALAGGVGGAKLADGLAQVLPPADLTIVVNTGDDFEHFGLSISPDLDTVCYTIAGLASPETGWGRSDETFQVFEELRKLGGPAWFVLGDHDLATHLERTRLLKEGNTLSQVTSLLCKSWNILARVLPMSDQPVHTMVLTQSGQELAFQEYFVHQKCEPRVLGFHFAGAAAASPAPGVLQAVDSCDAVVFCPSNPWVSIDPILSIDGIRAALAKKPVVAVSPIISGKALKGPAAKMSTELGLDPSALMVAHHYQELLAGFIMDSQDQDLIGGFSFPVLVTNTIMKDRSDRRRLAEDVLNLIRKLPLTKTT
jgi:LPPG:FO 2-phospho-L-lactate transferase